MAAIVKPIDAKSVHQIQSGQVIVDLCSVVKELVENSLDADASTIEVRFKNNGLDEIEVQDNGSGISPANYESVALKHYTSKLSTYDDLSTLHTFGFRGEALSSLCALSNFTITTAQVDEAPKGHRLEFEISGKLKSTSVVACQRGTIVTVQDLFEKLPVRRKELSKNIKREYGKVLGLLHAYACISTNVKLTVKNAMPKGKGMIVFATKSNTTTRENIANVYGAKTLSALVALDLAFDFPQTVTQTGVNGVDSTKVVVSGHISKPVFGEGRQTPDRQMFFVNGRPCGLPQIAKAINEVYKSFNVSQSPFIFADFQIDTNAYDVNVSPDKRTIFLHNATALTEGLKTSLTELFDRQDHTVPQSHLQPSKLPAFKSLNVRRESNGASPTTISRPGSPHFEERLVERACLENDLDTGDNNRSNSLLHGHFRNLASTREIETKSLSEKEIGKSNSEKERGAAKVAKKLASWSEKSAGRDEYDDVQETRRYNEPHTEVREELSENARIQVKDFNARMAEQQNRDQSRDGREMARATAEELPIASLPSPTKTNLAGPVQTAFDRMRPKRQQAEIATITIGDRTVTRLVGLPLKNTESRSDVDKASEPDKSSALAGRSRFAYGLQHYSAPGTQPNHTFELERIETDEVESQSGMAQRNQGLDVFLDEDDQDSELEHNEDLISASSESPGVVESTVHHSDPTLDTEAEARAAEEDRVAKLIQQAEDTAQLSRKGDKQTNRVLKGSQALGAVVSLAVEVELDLEQLLRIAHTYREETFAARRARETHTKHAEMMADNAEERLSLTVSKSDFATMHVVGQFNLGFILAVRHERQPAGGNVDVSNDELFIIDQHASDEKYNFERLQLETIVGNQQMVRPVTLDLTAVEEEIVIDSKTALEKNGFIVDVDTSGEHEVGKRCRLISLPLSKEVVFGTKDLDELIHLLAESPMLNDSSSVPRPSKVRKMFAMRACRSSIMIGKTLSKKQMSAILQHMGSIDKPWNCPHGRPTMRHLASLDTLNESLWREGDGVYPGDGSTTSGSKSASEAWKRYCI